MKTFKEQMIAQYKEAEQTPGNIAKAIMWKEKYNIMNTETLWLDEANKDFVSFIGNSTNYNAIERSIKGLSKVADKIFKAIPSLHFIYFSHLIFENK